MQAVYIKKKLLQKFVICIQSRLSIFLCMEQKYFIHSERLDWMPQHSQQDTMAAFVETDFTKAQLEEGKDVCYVFDKVLYTSHEKNVSYLKMAYSITQPDTLKTAGVFESVLWENDTYHLYQVAVYREGKWIDKLPDTTVKLIQHEQESGNGVTSNQQKVNVVIKDLRLYDIILIEEATVTEFDETDFLQQNFYRNIEVFSNTYWAYACYQLTLINDRITPITYRSHFFRDADGTLLPQKMGTI